VCLDLVISTSHGLQLCPGYYNPLLAYGEDKAIQDASESGANGFIMVDLPPEEAVTFREKCTKVK
jgi:tryptophan synthase